MQASISNRYYLRLAFYCCLLMLFSCSKEENAAREYPRLNTIGVSHTTGSATLFNAEIINGNPAAVTEYGFVWGTGDNPMVELDSKKFKTGAPAGHAFTDTIYSGLKNGDTYYMRAYIRTADYLVYGKTISFKSTGNMGPQLTGFSPEHAAWGDTLRITGRYFGYNRKNIQVKLGTITAPVIASTPESIDIVIPADKNNGKVPVIVSVDGIAFQSNSSFSYLEPAITSVSPLTGTYDDTLTVRGSNFSLDKAASQIFFDKNPARTISASREILQVIVPPSVTNSVATLYISGAATLTAYPTPFTLEDMELNGFTPDTIFTGSETLTITGRNFSPDPANNVVFINNTPVKIIACNTTSLKVTLPYDIIPNKLFSYQGSVDVRVKRGTQSATFARKLVIDWKSRWQRLNDFPGTARRQTTCFAIDGKGYMALGTLASSGTLSNNLWEYDPSSDRWTAKAAFPGKARILPSAFVIGNRAFLGLGSTNELHDSRDYLKDFYSYSPSDNTWTRVADYPSAARMRAASFVASGMGYVGLGTTNSDSFDSHYEFWRYNSSSNEWVKSLIFQLNWATLWNYGFSIGSEGYLLNDHKIYRYNKTTWDEVAEGPSFNIPGLTFTIGLSAYFACKSQEKYSLMVYNSETGKISQILFPKITLESVFTINGKAYFISADNQVWGYDPQGWKD